MILGGCYKRWYGYHGVPHGLPYGIPRRTLQTRFETTENKLRKDHFRKTNAVFLNTVAIT